MGVEVLHLPPHASDNITQFVVLIAILICAKKAYRSQEWEAVIDGYQVCLKNSHVMDRRRLGGKGELFKSSKNDQKRQLINFMFSNLELHGEKLEYSMCPPFHLMANVASYEKWLPFVEQYRTLCLFPEGQLLVVFQSMRSGSYV